MDEQTSPALDPATLPAGEANTDIPASEPNKTENPIVKPAMEILPETPVETLSTPESTPETVQTEPFQETPTAQMAGSEPFTPVNEEPTPKLEPVSETPTPSIEVQAESTQPETPNTAQTPQGANQPEPTPAVSQGSTAPEPTPEPPPAPAQTIVTPPRNIARLLLEKAKATIQLRKQKKLLKIMTLFEKKSHITNDEVEKLLHVSDATATRYLSELEKQGRILQSGKTGHAVSYTKC